MAGRLFLEGDHRRRAAESAVKIVGLARREPPGAGDVFLDHLFDAAVRRHLRAAAAARVPALLPRQNDLRLLRFRPQHLNSLILKNTQKKNLQFNDYTLRRNVES